MNRRHLGLLTGSSLAAAALPTARAKSAAPDATLLTTTLNPLGGERAGNADGSIPAWTGGLVSPPLPSNQQVDVPLFTDEQPLYTVDSSNVTQYQNLLTAGTQRLMEKFGLKIAVFETHRTAAAPQYVYDNTAKNVTRSKPEPAGARFGFTGGYGGVPFPIINTSDPFLGGAQVIWNHLLCWNIYSNYVKFSPGFVVTGGRVVLVYGGMERSILPYFDPSGSPETYDGYYSKEHAYFLLPPASDGGEAIVWTSSNTYEKPDITWSLVNGQGRVRKAPDEAYDTPSSASNGLINYDDSSGFAGSPQKYDWKVVGKQEMLVPYNCNAIHQTNSHELIQPAFPNPEIIRWEKHRVWVVEATLHPGERNTTARQICYMDEDTWMILLADMYDSNNAMVKTCAVYNRCVPSLPGTIALAQAFWRMDSGDYTVIGNMSYPPYKSDMFLTEQAGTFFNPEQMAASAAF